MADFAPLQPKVVLAVGAHADDIDFTASGTVAKWAAAGTEVHYLVVTDGSKGSSDKTMAPEKLIAMREEEQRNAAQALGVRDVHFLRYEDGALEVTMDLKKDIVRVIRQVRPDTVIAWDPTFVYYAPHNMINHPDHRAAGQATVDAVFPLARDHLSFPELYESEGLEPHKVAHVLLLNPAEQNYYVDISGFFEQKLQALERHISQIPDNQRVWDRLRAQAQAMGAKAGYQYAEGFMRIDTQP